MHETHFHAEAGSKGWEVFNDIIWNSGGGGGHYKNPGYIQIILVAKNALSSGCTVLYNRHNLGQVSAVRCLQSKGQHRAVEMGEDLEGGPGWDSPVWERAGLKDLCGPTHPRIAR